MTSTSAPDWSFLSPELRGGGAAARSADGRSECGCVDLHQVILVSCCTQLPSDWLTARPLEPVQVTSCLSLLVLQGSTNDTSISCGLMSSCVSLQTEILFLHHTASFTPLSGGSEALVSLPSEAGSGHCQRRSEKEAGGCDPHQGRSISNSTFHLLLDRL